MWFFLRFAARPGKQVVGKRVMRWRNQRSLAIPCADAAEPSGKGDGVQCAILLHVGVEARGLIGRQRVQEHGQNDVITVLSSQ